jgi:hypothetical protein
VIAPEVPARRPVRQAVLDDQAAGRLLRPMGAVALRQGQVGPVGVEAPAAVGTTVLGVGDHDVDRPAGADIPQVMERRLPRLQRGADRPRRGHLRLRKSRPRGSRCGGGRSSTRVIPSVVSGT